MQGVCNEVAHGLQMDCNEVARVLQVHCKGGGDEVANWLQGVAMMLQMCCKRGWLKGCCKYAVGMHMGCKCDYNDIANVLQGHCNGYDRGLQVGC